MGNDSSDSSNLNNTEKIQILGILATILVACVAGVFTLMAGFVQRPVPSTNPTQVVIVINATPIPTDTSLPTSVALTSQPGTNQTEPNLYPSQQEIPNKENQTDNKFSIPWGRWIIDFIVYMPQDTWIALTIFFGILFLLSGLVIFYHTKLSKEFRTGLASLYIITTFILSLSQWGWVGLVLWVFIILISKALLFTKFIFGLFTGALSGMLIGTSFSLFYMVWVGLLNKELITSWSVIGVVIGMIIGVIFVKEKSIDFYF